MFNPDKTLRLPQVTYLPHDRIFGAGLRTVERPEPEPEPINILEQDMFAYADAQAILEQRIVEHVHRNKHRLQGPPRWHHWRLWRLAINWRWCKS